MEPGKESFVKITVSMPRDDADVLRAAVAAGAAPSVSAYVATAVAERLRRESFHEKILALRDGRPWDQAALDWAYQALGATPDQILAVQARLGLPARDAGRIAS